MRRRAAVKRRRWQVLRVVVALDLDAKKKNHDVLLINSSCVGPRRQETNHNEVITHTPNAHSGKQQPKSEY